MIGALGICSNGAGCVGAWVAPIGEHVLQKASLPTQRALLRRPSRAAPAVLTDPVDTFNYL